MTDGVVTFHGLRGCQNILLAVVPRHHHETSAIEFLVAETDDARMTAVMLAEQCMRRVRDSFAGGMEQAMVSCVEIVRDIRRAPDLLKFRFRLRGHDVRQLEGVAYDDGILRTQQGEEARLERDLRRLVHNYIVVEHILRKTSDAGEGRAQYDGILGGKVLSPGEYVPIEAEAFAPVSITH